MLSLSRLKYPAVRQNRIGNIPWSIPKRRRRGSPFDFLALDLRVWLDPFVLSLPVLYTT